MSFCSYDQFGNRASRCIQKSLSRSVLFYLEAQTVIDDFTYFGMVLCTDVRVGQRNERPLPGTHNASPSAAIKKKGVL